CRRVAGWPTEIADVRQWYQPNLERIYEDAALRAPDLIQLEQIAGASTMELAQVELRDVEAVVRETCGKVDGSRSHQDVAADVDDAAGKVGGLSLRYSDPLLYTVGGLDLGQRSSVEGSREVQQMAVGQRGEARIQVVEAGVDQVQRGERCVPGVGYVAVTLLAGTNAVSKPEVVPVRVEHCIAFAFKG